jgi:DNA-binding MarR family transcriptional regulator/GNAT superfamily N-acetyltransferase
MTDVLQDLGATFLGSRLKRLGERMQAGAVRIAAEAGLAVQPAHMTVLATLDGQALTIGQLAQAIGVSQPGITRTVGQMLDLGLVVAEPGEDQRQRTMSLSEAGAAMLARAKVHMWPRVNNGVQALFGGDVDAFLARIAALEAVLDARPLDVLAAESGTPVLRIREFSDDLAGYFHDINVEWISAMYKLEATDVEVLKNPRAKIIDHGGVILFVEARGLGIVGTCALQKTGPASFELTKMGVLASARGLKAGEFLLRAIVERAAALGADPLYLLSNEKSAAAIHLYEKVGFAHDADIMARYGARYARCNVAMRYHPPGAAGAGRAPGGANPR